MRSNLFIAGITAMLLLLALVLPSSASDYTLGIYGNANEDSTINMQDVTFTELIILEYKEATELADAKHDSEVDILDVTQIELIILGQEKELTVLDSADRIVTVKKPVENIIVYNFETVETLRSINAADMIIAVGDTIIQDKVLFPGFTEYPNVGKPDYPDIEKVLELHPDIVFVYPDYFGDELTQTLESIGVTVIRLGCYNIEKYEEEINKIGYLLNKKEEVMKFLDFYNEFMNTINERIEEIPEEEMEKRFGTPYEIVDAPYGTYLTKEFLKKVTDNNSVYEEDVTKSLERAYLMIQRLYDMPVAVIADYARADALTKFMEIELGCDVVVSAITSGSPVHPEMDENLSEIHNKLKNADVRSDRLRLILGTSFQKRIAEELDADLIRVAYPAFDEFSLYDDAPYMGYRGMIVLIEKILNSFLNKYPGED